MQSRELTLSYIAGLIDGEGAIQIRKNHPRPGRLSPSYTTQVQVKMTDKEPIDLLFNTFGGSLRKHPPTPNRKPVYHWLINGKNAAAMLKELLPYFRIGRRISNALNCIKLAERMSYKGPIQISQEELAIREQLYLETKGGGISASCI